MKYKLIGILIISCSLIGCNSEQDGSMFLYNGEARQDSLFLGYYFGMSQQEFFDYSFKLNAQKVITNGSGAEIVKKESRLKADARMSFYPKFKNDKIFMMPVIYSYDGWAPWNTHLFADSLLVDLLEVYEDSLNVDFKRFEQDTTPEVYYLHRIDNQEIRMHTLSDSKVLVTFMDLSQVEK